MAPATFGVSALKDPDLDVVMARVGAYVVAYGDTLTALVADEDYVQQLRRPLGGAVQSRTLHSEVFYLRAPGSPEWIGFRNVLTMNGRDVRTDDLRLKDVFEQHPGSAMAAARRIADESARYNLGPIVRNFNMPATVLQFLHPDRQARFAFNKQGESKDDGRLEWIVSFEERRSPTIIRTTEGKDVKSKGRAWVEPETGRVTRTELVLDDFAPPVRGAFGDDEIRSLAEVTVAWRPDEGLGQWVPAEMRERYEGPWGVGRDDPLMRLRYTVTGVAVYGNVRRANVDVRLIVPK